MIRYVAILLGGGILLGAIGLAYVAFVSRAMPFHANSWQTSGLVTRFKMAKSIEQRQDILLVGKTREQIFELLGTPNQESSSCLFYAVDEPYGYKDGFSVCFKNGVVEHAYIHD